MPMGEPPEISAEAFLQAMGLGLNDPEALPDFDALPIPENKSEGNIFSKIVGAVGNIAKESLGKSQMADGWDILSRNILGKSIMPKGDSGLLTGIISRPMNTWTEKERELVMKMGPALISEQTAKSQSERDKALSINAGKLKEGSEADKKLDKLLLANNDLKGVQKDLEFAIDKGGVPDPNVVKNAALRLFQINSVVLEQGVVTDAELRLQLSGIMSDLQQLEAGGWDFTGSPRMLDPKYWKSIKNTLQSVNRGVASRMTTYKKKYSIPDEYFERQDIRFSPDSETGLNPNNAFSQSEYDIAQEEAGGIGARQKARVLKEAVKETGKEFNPFDSDEKPKKIPKDF